MDAIIETFGIDGRLIVIQIFNFAILLAALWYFLYQPIMRMLRDREERIAQGIKDAEAAEAAKAEADSKKQQILSEAEQEAEAVAARAREHAEVKASEIVESAKGKADQVVKEAHTKTEEMKVQAKKESEAEISKLAVLAAEKILRRES